MSWRTTPLSARTSGPFEPSPGKGPAVSSGIEPVYDFRLVRRDRLGEHIIEHPAYRAWRTAHPDAPLPAYFVTASELSPEEHGRVQAKIQEFTDATARVVQRFRR